MKPYMISRKPGDPPSYNVHTRDTAHYHGQVYRTRHGWGIRMPGKHLQARLEVPPVGRNLHLDMNQLMDRSPMRGKHLIHKITHGFARGRILHFRTREDAAHFAYLNY